MTVTVAAALNHGTACDRAVIALWDAGSVAWNGMLYEKQWRRKRRFDENKRVAKRNHCSG